VRLITQFGTASDDANRVRAAYPDVELIEYRAGEEPPAGLEADAFFGGYLGWDGILRWIDAAGVHWVQLTGTGIDSVPKEVFAGRTVTCARGASAVPISEWVMAAVLNFAKRLRTTNLVEPPRYWNFPDPPLDRIEGSTLALIGLGGIGTAVATRAQAFGMHVRAMRRTNAPSPVAGVQIVRTLDALLRDADHVVLAAPATARTQHLLGSSAFGMMKRGVHVVNIARGTLIDQDALRSALDAGTVAMASLDTVDPEPLPAGHWMYAHPNVLLTAHISWYTPELLRASLEILLENLGRFQRGEPLLHEVDPDEGY
jgi:phosphoglycerate dehydrogenase-like enzyme